MVPTPANHFAEMLDSIRHEYDQLTQEAYVCKSQRDEFEHKSRCYKRKHDSGWEGLAHSLMILLFYIVNSQIQEMSSFQQNLLELERTQQSIKKQ
jgi:glucose repression regulatory protein TUP1